MHRSKKEDKGCIWLKISHVRDAMVWFLMMTMPGLQGVAIRWYAVIRIAFSRASLLCSSNRIVGSRICPE